MDSTKPTIAEIAEALERITGYPPIGSPELGNLHGDDRLQAVRKIKQLEEEWRTLAHVLAALLPAARDAWQALDLQAPGPERDRLEAALDLAVEKLGGVVRHE